MLKKTQNLFQNYLRNRQSNIEDYIETPPYGTIIDRLAIYKDGYYSRLIQALSTDFPKLASFLGKQRFQKLAIAYINTYPSDNFSVNMLGRYFSTFIAQTIGSSQQKTLLAEMAAFEWSLASCVDVYDAPVLSVQDLQAVPAENWPNLLLKLHPSVNIFCFHCNVLAICEAIHYQKKVPKAYYYKRNQHCLVWRKSLQAYYQTCTIKEIMVFKAIQNGENCAAICRLLNAYMPEKLISDYIANFFVKWLQLGLLSELEYSVYD